MDTGSDRRAALARVPVSRETAERLDVYVDLLRRWQTVKNLVGPSTLSEIWTRHIADSAQLLDLAPAAARWVDLGSGAGFPGLVVAIMLTGRPDVRVDLIESNARKCAFLREVVRATAAPAQVHAARIEDVAASIGPVDVVTSRALAPLSDLLTLGQSWLAAGATGLFLKGDEEANDARVGVGGAYRADTLASRTHARGRIVVVRRADLWDNALGESGRKGGRNAE